MDPDANLREQLALAHSIQDAIDGRVTPDEDDVSRLTDLVVALDEFLRRGGFLPEPWRRS